MTEGVTETTPLPAFFVKLKGAPMRSYEIDDFVFSFPLRAIFINLRTDEQKNVISFGGIAQVTFDKDSKKGVVALAFFTDRDLADRHFEQSKSDMEKSQTMDLVAIDSPENLRPLLEWARSNGIRHATFDPVRKLGHFAFVVNIDKLIEVITTDDKTAD